MRNSRLMIGFLAAVFILMAVFTVFGQDDLSKTVTDLMASAPSFEYTETVVNFTNLDQKIVGTLAMSTTDGAVPLVLLFHGFKGERDELPIINTEEGMFSRTARIFAERGFATLRIDFRGSGESEGLSRSVRKTPT